RLLEHVRGDSADEDVVGFDVVELVLTNRECADVPAPRAAAELCAVLDVDDAAVGSEAELAREERARVLRRGVRNRGITATAAASSPASPRQHECAPADSAELEDVGVLQEEVPLLGEEQTEACQIDLPIVDLGSREVGIDRQRRVQ